MIVACLRKGIPVPVSVATARDPFRGTNGPTAQSRPAETGLRVPQARVLQALVPQYPEDPPSEWPLMGRAYLGVRAGYTAVSGTITRALNGIREGSSSGDPHPGLLARGLVEEVPVDVDGVVEVTYRATAAGIAAFQAYLASGGTCPPVKDAAGCTNDRYK